MMKFCLTPKPGFPKADGEQIMALACRGKLPGDMDIGMDLDAVCLRLLHHAGEYGVDDQIFTVSCHAVCVRHGMDS